MRGIVVTAFLLCVFSPSVWADARSDFAKAYEAQEDGNYQLAIDWYSKVINSGEVDTANPLSKGRLLPPQITGRKRAMVWYCEVRWARPLPEAGGSLESASAMIPRRRAKCNLPATSGPRRAAR